MIGLVGVAIFVVQFVRSPLLWSFCILGIVACVLWIVLLAIADAFATQQHFGRQRRRGVAEQVRLQVELRRHREREGNGEWENGGGGEGERPNGPHS